MKATILSIILFTGIYSLEAQNVQSISGIKFKTINNLSVDMRNYPRMKVIIATLDASNLNPSYMLSLDTFYRKVMYSAVVIAIPVSDFGVPVDTSFLVRLIDSLHISYPVTMISKGKRGVGQHPLMIWVTTNSIKNHFNINLQQPGQVFIISTTGVLYGELPAYVPLNGKLVSDGLSKEVTE